MPERRRAESQELSGAEPLSTYINSILTHRYTHDHHLTPPNQNSRCYFFRLHGPSPTRSGRLCCPARSESHSPHTPKRDVRGTTCRPTPWTSRTEVIWRLRLQAVQVQERLHLLLGLQDIAARRDNVAVTHALFRASCPHPVPHTPSRWQHEMLPRANWATSPFPSGENLYDQSIT